MDAKKDDKNKDSKPSSTEKMDAAKTAPTVTKEGKENPITSNLPEKKRVPAEHEDISGGEDKRSTPSTSGPMGTEEPGSDEGPGGTGW